MPIYFPIRFALPILPFISVLASSLFADTSIRDKGNKLHGLGPITHCPFVTSSKLFSLRITNLACRIGTHIFKLFSLQSLLNIYGDFQSSGRLQLVFFRTSGIKRVYNYRDFSLFRRPRHIVLGHCQSQSIVFSLRCGLLVIWQSFTGSDVAAACDAKTVVEGSLETTEVVCCTIFPSLLIYAVRGAVFWLVSLFVCWFVSWFAGWLIDWLIARPTCRLVDWLVVRLHSKRQSVRWHHQAGVLLVFSDFKERCYVYKIADVPFFVSFVHVSESPAMK